MSVFALVTFLCAVVCAIGAAAFVARDPGLKVGRVLGAVPGCIAWWGLMQTLWTIEPDPEAAVRLVRLSAIGWVPLGPLCLRCFVELGGPSTARLRPTLRWVDVSAGIALVIYALTPYGVDHVVPTEWGWAFRFGPFLPVAYLLAVVPCTFVLIAWRWIDSGDGGERWVSRSLYLGVAVGLSVATTTDVLLPLLGRDVPPLAVPTLTCVVVAVTIQLQRFGFSLISPAAYAREILDTLEAGVALLRPNGTIRDANRAFQALSGVPLAELRGTPVARFVPELAGVDWSAPLAEKEAAWTDSDGGARPIALSTSPLRREDGEHVGTTIIARDTADVCELRGQLAASARLAAMGELSAGIAHEINEPIGGVRRGLGDLRCRWSEARPAQDVPDAEQLHAEGEELIDECIEGVERVGAIVRDVAGFAADRPGRRRPVDVSAVVGGALRVVRPRPGSVVQVHTELEPVPAVAGAPQELEQVVVNLLQNAHQACGRRGRIEVRTCAVPEGVEISVRDDGPGIAQDHLDRIFDPFFTTKPVGEGTGLGLAISYHIVRNHGGEIHVTSQSGEGAEFVVSLPLAPAPE